MNPVIKYLIIGVLFIQPTLGYSKPFSYPHSLVYPEQTNQYGVVATQVAWSTPALLALCSTIATIVIGGGNMLTNMHRTNKQIKAEDEREARRLEHERRLELEKQLNEFRKETGKEQLNFLSLPLEDMMQVCRGVMGQANNNPMASSRGGSELYIPLMGAGGLLSFLGPIGWAITGTTMFWVGMNQLSKYMEDKYIKSFSGDNIFSKAMCADRSTMPLLDKAIPVDWSVLEQSNLKIYKDGTANTIQSLF